MESKKEFVQFSASENDGFYFTVKKRVNDHFKKNSISPYANNQMWIKTLVMTGIYCIPYSLIVSGIVASNLLAVYACWLIMGLGMIGIGTSVMHDAQHGAYSPRKRVNGFIGSILEMIGGFAITWRIQHNILHHTFTNIRGLDEDIQPTKLLRFSPSLQLRWYHRYQHLYAWLFYMLMTLFWMTAKDYLQVFRYQKFGLLATQNISLVLAIFKLTLYKTFYFGYVIVLPVLFSGLSWVHVLGGFLVMHFFAGLSLSCIFQPAHVMETSRYADPVVVNNKKIIHESWAEHEIANTANFARKSRLLSWFIGGLNYQIEHHLFTNICHIHYPKIAPIVKNAVLEFGMPYHEYATFGKALKAHWKMLKLLGKNKADDVPQILAY